jgi:hypothetical protein
MNKIIRFANTEIKPSLSFKNLFKFSNLNFKSFSTSNIELVKKLRAETSKNKNLTLRLTFKSYQKSFRRLQ